MGQNVSVAPVSAGAAGINVKELEDLAYEKSLGIARFMKCIRARHRNGLVVVRVAMRPFSDFDFSPFVKAIRHERDQLAGVPNALSFQRVIETEHTGFLVRQYVHSSLYDRLSTRPFLEDIEKKWLAFQLLCAVRDCHTRNIYHGDIKAENIVVTSWNWLYLTDFSSSFKKTYLPEDNPADFSYFFDTSGRRTCYVAPERFLGAGQEGDDRGVTWAMDVFSAGCVIAELFLEAPIFSLSQLFKYRKGEYDPGKAYLRQIQDADIQELVMHMIQVEPEARYSAEEYLNFWRRKAFPEYFYSFLHQYMGLITDPSSGHASVEPETTNFGEADDRIDRVYYDFDKISYFLGYEYSKVPKKRPALAQDFIEDVLPLQIDLPNNRHTASGHGKRLVDDGSLIFLTLVVSSLRNSARSNAKLRACDLMLAFGERITDEAKLDRVLPFLVVLLNDPSDMVKITALRAITQLLALINCVSPVNAYVFTEYLRPRLQNMVHGPGPKMRPMVRATYAACLASLAHSSVQILDMVQALRADGSIPSIDPEAEEGTTPDAAHQTLFDIARLELIEHFEVHTKALLTDSSTTVRRAFLGSVSSLCAFFGSAKANDVILSHLNTYLNDQDWMLKCSFFQTIVGVATFVGSSSLEEFILPLMLQALTDPEEFVVEKVLSSFASMAELGLFQRARSWEMVDIIARFMVHPNSWIREAATHFISATTRFLNSADTHCIILPLIQPYLKTSIAEFSETTILDALKRPLPRVVLEMAATWSSKVDRGMFWKPAHSQHTFSFGATDRTISTISSRDLTLNVLRRVPKNDEDEQWLNRLRNLGMTADDEFKLLALRDYILRMTARRPKDSTRVESPYLKGVVYLKQLNITPQTIFFESHRKLPEVQRRNSSGDHQVIGNSRKAHTLTDALLDASTTVDDPLTNRKKSYANARKERLNSENETLTVPLTARRASFGVPSTSSSSPSSRVSSTTSTIAPPSILQAQTDDVASDGTTTPTDSLSRRSSTDYGRTVRAKSSAITLLSRKETFKAVPETGTDATNAVGEMDGPFSQNKRANLPPVLQVSNNSKPLNRQVAHTYDGKDPNVIRLLDSLAGEKNPVDETEFGPSFRLASRRTLKKSDAIPDTNSWRPQGIHLATFGEHGGPINRILPSPDHVFFLTASDDGSIKVWDTGKLERSLIQRSRQTHNHGTGARVICITFVEDTHTFVSCATDGSIHVVKVECSSVGDTIRYSTLRLKRTYQLPEDEHAVWCEHFRSRSNTSLILVTNTSRIISIDLKTMTTLYTLNIPLHYGTPTTFCLDPDRHWLLLGTFSGVLGLYDLRFQFGVRFWALAGGYPIYRTVLHPSTKKRKDGPIHEPARVVVAGGTGQSDVTTWEIESMQCREAFLASSSPISTSLTSSRNRDNLATNKQANKPYQPVLIEELKPEDLLQRFATHTSHSDPSIRSLIIGTDDTQNSPRHFFITGGMDRKVRFWDTTTLEASAIVSGLETDELQPKYVSVQSALIPGLVMNVEKAEFRKKDEVEDEKRRIGRTMAMQKEQQALLRGHLDVITDVALLQGQAGAMVLSADRKGCVYVFQ